MRITGWITKAADTRSECVILIAFSQQQWLRERAQYYVRMCIVCIVYPSLTFTVMAVHKQFTEMYPATFMEKLRIQAGIILSLLSVR
jgi:hypothetical protein